MRLPHPSCPRCGRASRVEELGETTGSTWLHCELCGHLWRRLDPERDPFSLILENRSVVLRAVPELDPDGTPRASRFEVRLEMRYRLEGDTEWRSALTENISRSGVLFRSPLAAEPRTALDIILVVPGGVAGEPASRLRCRGEVVRIETSADEEMMARLAAVVTNYELAN